MAFDLASIQTGRVERPPRILLLGTPGVGKSEFLSSAPGVIIAPVIMEEGLDALECPKFPPVKQFADIHACMGTLYQEDHEFKTFGIDSSTTFEPLVVAEAMLKEGVNKQEKLGGGFGRQWDTPMALWTEVLQGLDVLRNEKNMTIVITGHTTVRAARDPESESWDAWAYDIDKRIGDKIVRWADLVLFMHKKHIIKKGEDKGFGKKEKQAIDASGGQRFLKTSDSPTHPGKNRLYRNLPEEIPLPRDNAFQTLLDSIAASV